MRKIKRKSKKAGMEKEKRFNEILSELERAREKTDYKTMKKVLKKMKYLYKPFFHGTSSGILVYLKKTKGKIVPFGELEKLGIIPFSGELGRGITKGGVSRRYVSGTELKEASIMEEYARPVRFDIEEEKRKVEEEKNMLKNSNLSDELKSELRELIKVRERRIEEYEKLSEKDKRLVESQYPVIIAAEPKIEHVLVHTDTSDILTKEINLKTRKTTIFVPKDKVWKTRWELFKRGIIGVKVLPMEYYKEYEKIAREAAKEPIMGSTLQRHPAIYGIKIVGNRIVEKTTKEKRKEAKEVIKFVKKAIKKLKK